MAKALTPAAIDKMKPPAKRVEVPDPALSGLYLVLQPSGAKSWAVRYRFAGRPRKMTLGKWPIIGLADARRAASGALADVEVGRDPGAAKVAAKKMPAQTASKNSVEDLVQQFARRHLSKLRSGDEVKRALTQAVLPHWGSRDVRSITKRDVLDLLDAIVDSGRATTANRVRAYLSKFFGWCAERDIIDASPMLGVKAPAKEKTRDRVLTDDEVRWFWQACEEVGQPWGHLGRMLLLTGQRLGEVAAMTDDEIAGDTWHLSADRTKNARQHDVPLSAPAQAVLGRIKRVKGRVGYLHTTTGKTPVSGYFKARNNIAKRMKILAEAERGEPVNIPHWTFHDLRRTTATGMARLGISVIVIEAILNHVSGARAGVAGIYNRHAYEDEKRSAMEAWGRFVTQLVEGGADNVVRLEGKR